jgi:hypothetical protein
MYPNGLFEGNVSLNHLKAKQHSDAESEALVTSSEAYATLMPVLDKNISEDRC